MTEPQYRVIADMDKGDNPSGLDVRIGDRWTLEHVPAGASETRVVRIERPVPTTDEQQRRFRVVDIDQGVIDEDNNEVTFTLSELDEQPSPSLPTREQIELDTEHLRFDVASLLLNRQYNGVPTVDADAFYEGRTADEQNDALATADGVRALIQKGADR